jgi:CBS domain containing-hemolysin-like protein
MEDIIETLLGLEIVDEKDTITDMQAFARERWETRQAKYNLIEKLNKNDE